MATGEFPSVGNNVLLVGIGNIGCELAAQCTNATVRRLLNFDADALADYPNSEAICLPGEPENTGEMEPEAMRLSAADAALEILGSAPAANGLVVLLCAVGGQTGSVVIPALVAELKAAQCTVVVIALEPTPFEAAGRADAAARAIAELANIADLVLPVPNRPLADLCDPAWPVHDAVAHLKRKTIQATERLLRALTCASCVGLQPADIRRAITDAGRGALAVGMASGDQRVEKAIRDACANSFLTQQSCQHASAAVLHLVGSTDLSLREVHAATELLAQLVGKVPIQVGLSIDRSLGDAIQATILLTGVHQLQTEKPDAEFPAPTSHSQDLSHYDGVNLDIPAFIRNRAANFAHQPKGWT